MPGARSKDSNDHVLIEQVVQIVSADNLDLGCTLIEKAATEKAVRDIEEALAPAFAIRRNDRVDIRSMIGSGMLG